MNDPVRSLFGDCLGPAMAMLGGFIAIVVVLVIAFIGPKDKK